MTETQWYYQVAVPLDSDEAHIERVQRHVERLYGPVDPPRRVRVEGTVEGPDTEVLALLWTFDHEPVNLPTAEVEAERAEYQGFNFVGRSV